MDDDAHSAHLIEQLIEQLTRYRLVTAGRDKLFRDAVKAGMPVNQIHIYSGAALSTIYRVIGRRDG